MVLGVIASKDCTSRLDIVDVKRSDWRIARHGDVGDEADFCEIVNKDFFDLEGLRLHRLNGLGVPARGTGLEGEESPVAVDVECDRLRPFVA